MIDIEVFKILSQFPDRIHSQYTFTSYICHMLLTGNHEYYTGDVDSWIRELPRVNIKPLINEHICLFSEDTDTCHGGLYLAGIEDYETRRMR